MLDLLGGLFIAIYLAALAALAFVPRLPLLVGVHAFRIGGAFFVALALTQRLAPAFGWIAGIGDVAVGIGAIVLLLRWRPNKRALKVWNALGALDLVLAATLAIASRPDMRPMQALPWILVPAVIVPGLLVTHLVIARKVHVQ